MDQGDQHLLGVAQSGLHGPTAQYSSNNPRKQMVVLDVLSLARIFNVSTSIPRPQHVVREKLLIGPSSPPLLVVKKRASNNTGANHGVQYSRQLAQKLHARIQTFCPDPMCVLSLVADEKEGDLADKIAEAVAKASRVLPFSRTVMTQAKYESILKAMETQLGFSAFQAALTEPGGAKTQPEHIMTRDSIKTITNIFSPLGHELRLRHTEMKTPRLLQYRKSASTEKLTWSDALENVAPPRRPILLFRSSTAHQETVLEASEYGQLSFDKGKIQSHREFLFTDFKEHKSADVPSFHDAVQGREVIVWVLYDAADYPPEKIDEELAPPPIPAMRKYLKGRYY